VPMLKAWDFVKHFVYIVKLGSSAKSRRQRRRSSMQPALNLTTCMCLAIPKVILRLLFKVSNVWYYIAERSFSHGEAIAIWTRSTTCEISREPKSKEIYQKHYWIVEVK
jgi:hypothetical protein